MSSNQFIIYDEYEILTHLGEILKDDDLKKFTEYIQSVMELHVMRTNRLKPLQYGLAYVFYTLQHPQYKESIRSLFIKMSSQMKIDFEEQGLYVNSNKPDNPVTFTKALFDRVVEHAIRFGGGDISRSEKVKQDLDFLVVENQT